MEQVALECFLKKKQIRPVIKENTACVVAACQNVLLLCYSELHARACDLHEIENW